MIGDHFNPNTHEYENLEQPTQDTSTDRDVELTEELYQHYSDAQYEWSTRGRESKDFVHNVQFTKEQIDVLNERGQAATPINVLWPAMEQAVAMLTANTPSFQATAEEDSDVKTASAISDVVAHDWYKSHGNEQLKIALFDYYQTGRGVIQTYVDPDADYGKGAVRFRAIDSLMVYPDPNSRDRLWRDASHILIKNLMTAEQILAIWPDASEVLPAADTIHDNYDEFTSSLKGDGGFTRGRVYDNHHSRYQILERYTKVRIEYQHVAERPTGVEQVYLPEEFEQYLETPAVIISMPDGSQQFFIGDMVQSALQLLEQAEPTEDDQIYTLQIDEQGNVATIKLTNNAELIEIGQIVRRRVLLDRVMHVITIGNQLYWKGYLPISHYPLTPIHGRWDHDPYPMSDVEFVRPIQESINKIHSQIIANLANSTNVKVFVPRGSVDMDNIEMDFAKSGAAVIEFDAEMGVPQVISPLAPPAALFSYAAELRMQIERELGVFSVQQGDPTGAPNTYRGTLAIDEYGQRRIKSKLDDIESALSQVARVALQFMQYAYREERVIRLLQANNRIKETVVNFWSYDDRTGEALRINDLSVGQYDVRMIAGSTLPSNRWALLEYYMQMYQMGIIDQSEVLKKTDIVDAQGVMERMSLISQLQQQVQMLAEENKQLKGDLQTADREAISARQRVSVAKADADMHKIVSDAQAAAQIYKAQARMDSKNSDS